MAIFATCFLLFAPRDEIIAHALEDFQEATGLQAQFSEPSSVTFLPVPGWQIGSLKVTTRSEDDKLISTLVARNAVLGISLRGLFRRTWRIGAVWMTDAKLSIHE